MVKLLLLQSPLSREEIFMDKIYEYLDLSDSDVETDSLYINNNRSIDKLYISKKLHTLSINNNNYKINEYYLNIPISEATVYDKIDFILNTLNTNKTKYDYIIIYPYTNYMEESTLFDSNYFKIIEQLLSENGKIIMFIKTTLQPPCTNHFFEVLNFNNTNKNPPLEHPYYMSCQSSYYTKSKEELKNIQDISMNKMIEYYSTNNYKLTNKNTITINNINSIELVDYYIYFYIFSTEIDKINKIDKFTCNILFNKEYDNPPNLKVNDLNYIKSYISDIFKYNEDLVYPNLLKDKEFIEEFIFYPFIYPYKNKLIQQYDKSKLDDYTFNLYDAKLKDIYNKIKDAPTISRNQQKNVMSNILRINQNYTLYMLKHNIINKNAFYLYGSQQLCCKKYNDAHFYFSGESHLSNVINIPYNSIHMYKFFETLIEYYLTQTQYDIHICMENTPIDLYKRIINNNIICNDFLNDAVSVFYYLNLCKYYLKLKNSNLFAEIIKDKNLEGTLMSNFINDQYNNRINFHLIDHRDDIYERIVPKDERTKLSLNNIYHHLNVSFSNNILIFPEVYGKEDKSNYDIHKNHIFNILDPILNEEKTKTIYREIYDELIENKFTTLDTIETIFKEIKDNDPSYGKIAFAHIMDHIMYLKLLYLEYKKKNPYTVLFHGGKFHTNLYYNLLNKIKPSNSELLINLNIKTNIEPNLCNNILDIQPFFTKYSEIKEYFDKTNISTIYDCNVFNKHLSYYQQNTDFNIYPIFQSSYEYDEYINSIIDKSSISKFKSKLESEYKGGKSVEVIDYSFDNQLNQINKDLYTPKNSANTKPKYQLQITNTQTNPVYKLNALERAELAELDIFFKDINIKDSIEQLFKYNTITSDNTYKLTKLSNNSIGGHIFMSQWVKFLLQ